MEFAFGFCPKEKVSIKKIIPSAAKLRLNLLKREFLDMLSGVQFAKKVDLVEVFSYQIERSQAIKQTTSFSAKRNNLEVAAKCIESFQINPQEVFCFWKAVGAPTRKRGFEEGRTIVNGKLSTSIGGGLCQLSGLMYYICLEANLDVIERHNHSLDIYTDETRYTPLGSDATVAYGYKDLRVRNNQPFPIRFSFSITDEELLVKLIGTDKIGTYEVNFEHIELPDNQSEVITHVAGKPKTKSKYLRLTTS